MISADTQSIIRRAKEIYQQKLKVNLETDHMGKFVAIEPDSGDYFLADTFDAAVKSARTKYPDRLSHTIRIGHRAAFHLGVGCGSR